MFNYSHLGKFMRKTRQEKHLSMQCVADIIGITVEALGRFERGTSNLKLENIMALCDIYDLPAYILSNFYSRSDEMQEMMNILLTDVATS